MKPGKAGGVDAEGLLPVPALGLAFSEPDESRLRGADLGEPKLARTSELQSSPILESTEPSSEPSLEPSLAGPAGCASLALPPPVQADVSRSWHRHGAWRRALRQRQMGNLTGDGLRPTNSYISTYAHNSTSACMPQTVYYHYLAGRISRACHDGLLHWTSAGGPQSAERPTWPKPQVRQVIEDIGSVDERDLNERVEEEQQRETSRRQKELFPNYGAWTHVTDVLGRAVRTEPHQRLPNHAEQCANAMVRVRQQRTAARDVVLLQFPRDTLAGYGEKRFRRENDQSAESKADPKLGHGG